MGVAPAESLDEAELIVGVAADTQWVELPEGDLAKTRGNARASEVAVTTIMNGRSCIVNGFGWKEKRRLWATYG